MGFSVVAACGCGYVSCDNSRRIALPWFWFCCLFVFDCGVAEGLGPQNFFAGTAGLVPHRPSIALVSYGKLNSLDLFLGCVDLLLYQLDVQAERL